MPALQLQITAPSTHHANDREHITRSKQESELAALWEKQHALQKRLTTLQRQQLHENIGRFTRSTSSLGLPDSLEMIVYGLREELERVAHQILLLRSEN